MQDTIEGMDGSCGSGLGGRSICRLVVVHGERRGGVASLDSDSCTLVREGTSPGAFALEDPQVSKRHAVLERGAANTWSLTDCGSRNGTFLNGARIERAPLRDGAVLRVGGTVLLFEQLQLPATAQLLAETTGLKGPSLHLQRIRGDLALFAPHPLSVLILGETGTGKERVAEEVHRLSRRPGRFVPVNCSAISAELAESELFGHVAGAFTGAARASEGLFRAAHRGTLFLDEVGDMPLELQPKLLRALSKGEVRSVGAAEAATVDVRVVAATHRDLSGAVECGQFRADLLARLAGWTVELPALRARREDILTFARLTLERSGGSPRMSANAAEALLLHTWPLNVREVEQCLGAAAARAGGGTLERRHLPPAMAGLLRDRAFPEDAAVGSPLEARLCRNQMPTREELAQVLSREQGNIARVALFFGKDRRQVYRWAERLGVDVDASRRMSETPAAAGETPVRHAS